MLCSDLPGLSTSVASNEPLVLFKLKTRIVYSCFFESERQKIPCMYKDTIERSYSRVEK